MNWLDPDLLGGNSQSQHLSSYQSANLEKSRGRLGSGARGGEEMGAAA